MRLIAEAKQLVGKVKDRKMLETKLMMGICIVMLGLMISGMAIANDTKNDIKRTLKGNMTEVYNQVPGMALNISEMFTRGMFYGRIRVHAFLWDWSNEKKGTTKDNWALGIGGSLIYKTAYLNGVGLTAGMYTSQNPWHVDGDDYQFVRTGKDVFSRYQIATADDYGMTVLAQSYLEYKFKKSSIRAGRQIFESLLTSSNDTKMIPNTFQGITLESSNIPDTQLKAAWFDGQKLRDHLSFHHVLAYGDDPQNPHAAWTENDDSAMHKGLTLSKLKAKDIDDMLCILQGENKSLSNLSIMVNVTEVPDLVGSATGEMNYTISIGKDLKLVPGIRFLRQFDRGGGKIGGASLSGKISSQDSRGYHDPYSLDGDLFAARIELTKGQGNYLVGYSMVSDDSDLVTPWRGFPTSSYTRAMGQYNWYANTTTWMLQASYDFAKAELVPGFSVQARYAIQDFDDQKPDVPADNHVLNLDFTEKITAFPGLEMKLRVNIMPGESDIRDRNGKIKTDPSANEYRLEINYLF